MNTLNFISYLFCAIIASSYVILGAEGEDSYQSLKFQVREFAAKGEFAEISKLIEAEEALWKTAPHVSYFEKMKAIGFGLMDGASGAERYWLFRKVAWNALLKPTPAAKEPMDTRRADGCKEDLIWASEDITPFIVGVNSDMYVSIRHDTALLLIEYAKQIHAAIVPAYRNKPIAPGNDPIGRQLTKQNEIDNAVQDESQSASLRLSGRQHLNYLIRAYARGPRDEQEVRVVLNALNIQGVDRERVMRSALGPRAD